MPDYTERDRESLLSAMISLQTDLDRLGGPINKADLTALPEHFAKVDKLIATFLVRLRSIQT